MFAMSCKIFSLDGGKKMFEVRVTFVLESSTKRKDDLTD